MNEKFISFKVDMNLKLINVCNVVTGVFMMLRFPKGLPVKCLVIKDIHTKQKFQHNFV